MDVILMFIWIVNNDYFKEIIKTIFDFFIGREK